MASLILFDFIMTFNVMIIPLRDPGLATGEVEGENFFGDPVDSIHSDR